MNKVFLSGNLTRDPEVHYTNSGKAYVRVGLAVNRPFSKDKAVDFFNLFAWEKTAEIIGDYLKKGSRLVVEGRLQTNSYEKDGVKHNAVDVIVEQVVFVDSKKKESNYYSPDGEPVDDGDVPF